MEVEAVVALMITMMVEGAEEEEGVMAVVGAEEMVAVGAEEAETVILFRVAGIPEEEVTMVSFFVMKESEFTISVE